MCVCASAMAGEHNYSQYLRYPAKLVPGVGLDKVEQEGGDNAVGYTRRTVEWWPRKGQDIVDISEGAPLTIRTNAPVRFNAMEPRKDATYPRWGRESYNLVFETPHFYIIARPDI